MEKISIPEWNDMYNTGIPEIDIQHKFFLSLIKRIVDQIDTGLSEELITRHIDEILFYTRFHFCSEENLMILKNYPHYLAHKQIHINLVNKLSNMITLYSIKKIDIFEIVLFLIEWFFEHTTKEDAKIYKFLNP